MIRALVDYALNNRFLVLAVALLLLVWGAISFHNLPVEVPYDLRQGNWDETRAPRRPRRQKDF